ncbi:MAG: hypothetical protein AB1324_04150 [Candidatus Micrarchaeota archaeon]
MGLFGRKERLRDVPEVQPLLKKAGKVAFFAPHTSEHPAVMPLISELSAALRGGGRECETHSIEDMRAAVASISLRISRLRLRREELEGVERVLRMKDAIVRLGIAIGVLAADEKSLLVEVHALPGDFALGDRFGMGAYFYRVPGTRILYSRDYAGEYAVPIRLGMEALSRIGSGRFVKAACIAGADLGEAADALALIPDLEHRASRALLIEVPAPFREPDDWVPSETEFGKCYGANLSGFHTLAHWEMERLLETIA